MKIYENPLTPDERQEVTKQYGYNCFNKTPVRFHLIDILKNLKFGRPGNNQTQIDKWVTELEQNPENGSPFSSALVNEIWDDCPIEE